MSFKWISIEDADEVDLILATEFQSELRNLNDETVEQGRVKVVIGDAKVLEAKKLYDGLVRLRPIMQDPRFDKKCETLRQFLENQQ